MVLLAEFVPWLHVVVEQPAVIDDARDEVHVVRSEEHTSELQSQSNLVCRLLLEKKKKSNSPFLATMLHIHATSSSLSTALTPASCSASSQRCYVPTLAMPSSQHL